MKTVTLTEKDVNELAFMLANLNSPSKIEAMKLVEEWRTKLTIVSRHFHPLATPTVNVD